MGAVEIKIWLLNFGYTQSQIAKEVGLSRQTVWKTVHGKEKNQKVIQWLMSHGYPNNLLEEAFNCES